MGNHYPAYTTDGGVSCYVVEAIPRNEWLPNYYLNKMIYWLDQHSLFPLRIEQYNRTGKLTLVTVRTATLDNPQLGERGYAVQLDLSWDLSLDLMTASIHKVIPRKWSEVEKSVFFQPRGMPREWVLPALAGFPRLNTSDEFFLRPHLDEGKFPEDRKIELAPELAARIAEQERVGHLVF